jgi:hypothetical protein
LTAVPWTETTDTRGHSGQQARSADDVVASCQQPHPTRNPVQRLDEDLRALGLDPEALDPDVLAVLRDAAAEPAHRPAPEDDTR